MPDQSSALPLLRRTPELQMMLSVPAELIEPLWELYEDVLRPLERLAALEHLYPRKVFEGLLHDQRIVKFVAFEGSDPIGASLMTNHLRLVPQISPAFLRHQYPEQALRNSIFFAIVVFARAERGGPLAGLLMAQMGQLAARYAGVLVFDVCEHNRSGLNIDRHARSIERWFPASNVRRIDQQSYYAVDLPQQAPADRFIGGGPASDCTIDLTRDG